MGNNRILLQLALDQLAGLYQSENLLNDYLKVLQNKACSEDLQWQIFGQMHTIQERSRYLQNMLSHFKKDYRVGSCESIRGIVQSGLKLVAQYPKGEAGDMALVHALLMIHHYKLGVYKTMLAYCNSCGLRTEAGFMLKCVREEENTLRLLYGMCLTAHAVDDPQLSAQG